VLNSDKGGTTYLHFADEAQSYLSKGSCLRYRFEEQVLFDSVRKSCPDELNV
jgi:hypothetical protein